MKIKVDGIGKNVFNRARMKIETKLSVGDEAWIMNDNKPTSTTITEIQVTVTLDGNYQTAQKPVVLYILSGNHCSKYESELFASKADLIASL